jgi:hypothetical protein
MFRETGPTLLVVVVLLSLCVGTAAADTTVTSSTTYNGTSGDSQRIQVEVGVTADVVTENLSVTFRSTRQSFLLYNSFERTQPDGVSIANPSRGTYVIDQLQPGQRVQFQFVVYPKRIGTESLDVVRVVTESDQNPDRRATRVSANLSSSPVFALEVSRNRVTALQSRVSNMQLAFYGGLGFGVLGLVGMGLLYRKTKRMVPESEVCNDLQSIRTGVSGDSNQQVVDRYLEDYDCETDTSITGVTGGTTGGGDDIETGTQSTETGDEPDGGSDDDDDIGPVA